MSALGVILARGGSKRLPGKNKRILAGVPLVVWTMWAGYHARSLDALVVSSDDDEILDIAARSCVDTIKRPDMLATDEASSYDALLHAIDFYPRHDTVVLLQPTSPLRTEVHVDEAFQKYMLSSRAALASFEGGKDTPNGAIYIASYGWLRTGGNWDAAGVERYDMMPDASIDIDTLEDFDRAEKALLGVR